MSDSDSQEYDVGALEAAHDDMKRLLDEELKTHETLADRGGILFRYNLIILGALISAASVVDTDILVHKFSVGGGVLLLIAALLGFIVQYRIPVDAGPTKEIPERVENANPTESAYRRWSLRAYKNAIENASKKSNWKENLVKGGQILTLGGITSIIIGIYMSLGAI